MPLHRFYIPPNLYTAEDKAKLAEAITNVYTFIPRFYVVVLFIEVDQENCFVGGNSTKGFVRILVHHLARQFENDEKKVTFMDMYEDAIKPFTKDRGLDWEVAVSDEDPKLWRENGLIPPHAVRDKEAEDLWKRENRPIPYRTKL
ncbi:4-oxalocrotonate tautomerase [Hymenopellis radicata]|nr:4-oxalocrotonate tautomerase [Hymenopellis radicata]